MPRMALEDLVDDVAMNDREERSDNEDFRFGDLDDPDVIDRLHTVAHSDAPRPPSHADQLMTMMQQQQAQLQKVLDGQQAMELRQSVMDTKLASLQEQILSQRTNSSPSSSSDGKRKRVVTRTLSVRIPSSNYPLPTLQLTRFAFLPQCKVYAVHKQLDVLFDTSDVYVYILTAILKYSLSTIDSLPVTTKVFKKQLCKRYRINLNAKLARKI